MKDSQTLVQILRLCIVRGSAGPWDALFVQLQELIERAFRSMAPHQHDLVGEFRDWLPGWLIVGQRLESAHTWFEERLRNESAIEQDAALRNYLYQTFRSGAGDFLRERSGRSQAARAVRSLPEDASVPETRSDRITAADQESLAHLREALAALPLSLRVPFRLQHYEACGPLLADEIAYVAELSGLAPDAVMSRIDAELREHQGAEFPIGAEFIGQLLQIPTSADGRFSAVHARVSRGRQRLRERLHPPEEQT